MAHAKASTPAQYVLILIDMVEEQGCDREQLLAGTTLAQTGISSIGARISDTDFNRLVTNALSLTGDPALGLKLGLRLNLSAHAVLGQAFMTCRDLGQVMDLFLKYYHLLAPACTWNSRSWESSCVLTTVSIPRSPLEFSYELMYGAILNTLRGLLNSPTCSCASSFPTRNQPMRPSTTRCLATTYTSTACAGGFLSTATCWNAPALLQPGPAHLYEAECARLLADLEGEDSVAEQTLRLLRKLEGQYPQMPQIANMLNLSPRTYRRRLERKSSPSRNCWTRCAPNTPPATCKIPACPCPASPTWSASTTPPISAGPISSGPATRPEEVRNG